MNTRTAVRQRYPDLGKELKVVGSYEKYAKFEMELNEPGRILNGSVNYTYRVQELKAESARTLEALNQKQPVRIPELSGPKTTADNVDRGNVDCCELRFGGGNREKAIKEACVQENG